MTRDPDIDALREHEAQLEADTLDDLLIRWHDWQQRSTVARGYNGRSLVAGEYRSSRQYDDVTGVLDDDLDDDRSKQVQFHVEQIGLPHRWALHIEARNLSLGVSVWQNPRLPADPHEREVVRSEARVLLTVRLKAAGVM